MTITYIFTEQRIFADTSFRLTNVHYTFYASISLKVMTFEELPLELNPLDKFQHQT